MHITTNGTIDPDPDTGSGEWGEFLLGAGGSCLDRDPPVGYFCAPTNPRMKDAHPNHPSGIVVTEGLLPNLAAYKNLSGAVIHAWRPAHWYTNMFEIESHTKHPHPHRKGDDAHGAAAPASATLMFSRGGFQGAEGVVEGEGWYIENVLAELDMEREWYFDVETQVLIYKPNTTTTAATTTTTVPQVPTGQFVATNLKVLFNIVGTKDAPVHHVAIQDITLRDTAYTYMDPHGNVCCAPPAQQPLPTAATLCLCLHVATCNLCID